MRDKVTEMTIGQVWVSLDAADRGGGVEREVTGIANGMATIKRLDNGRQVTVNCSLFLKRQGTKAGYELVSE